MKFSSKFISRLKNEEKGAVLIIVVLAMVVLLGMAAFAVDFGLAYNSKADLQNAADAAALAGAQELPLTATAMSTAYTYAEANGCPQSQTTVTTPYNGDSSQIEVVCSDTVDYYFAQVLGVSSGNVSARAVAQYSAQWDGDALPFVNLDDNYANSSKIVAWEKTGPGDFESINSADYQIINGNDPDTCYFKVNYGDGLITKKGRVANVKQEVGYIYDRVHPDQPIYILSLSSEVIDNGRVLLTNGTTRKLSKLKNGDDIDPSQLVLLECLFDYYDYKGKSLELTVLNEYDIINGEQPPAYSSSNGGMATMIE